MLIIPAIDLKGGQCVRLRQGRAEEMTVFSDDPVAMGLKWQAAGAKWLHLVDLDGAFSGSPQNLESIRRLRAALTIPIELGGGIRTLDTIKASSFILHPSSLQESDERHFILHPSSFILARVR